MKKQNFLKGSIILMVSALTAKILGAVFKIPLTNMLGGVGMSYFSSAYSLFMPLYSLTATGFTSAVARMTAKSAAFGMYRNVKRIRNTALAVFSLTGLAGSIIMFLTAETFSMHSSGGYEVYPSALMIAPAVFFGCVISVSRGYYEGMCNMYPTAVSQAIEGIVKAAAGLSLCYYADIHSNEIMRFFPMVKDSRSISAAAGILGVTLSSLAALVFFIFLRIFSRKKTEKGEDYVEKRKDIAGELIKNAIPVGMGSVVTNLTALIDMYTVIGFISVENTVIPNGISEYELPQFVYGSYVGIALTVFNLVPSVTNMLGKGVLPVITEAWENSDSEGLRRGTVQALLTASVIAVPCAVGLAVLPEQVLNVLYYRQPDEVSVCVDSLRILMFGMVCLCLSFPVFSMLQAIGKASAPLKIMLAGTVMKLLGNVLLISEFGIEGAAISTSLCYGFILLVSLFVYIKNTKTEIGLTGLLSVLYSGVMCGGAAWITKCIAMRNGAGDIVIIISSAISGGIFYIVSVWLLLSDKKRTVVQKYSSQIIEKV